MISNFASLKYDSVRLLESISTIPIVLHEGARPYADQMGEKVDTFGFGERLAEARKAAGLTQAELGKGAGRTPGKNASKQSIRDWEKGEQFPGVQQLRALCLRLNISADELLFRDIKDRLKFYQAEALWKDLTPEQRAQITGNTPQQEPASGKSATLQTEHDQRRKHG